MSAKVVEAQEKESVQSIVLLIKKEQELRAKIQSMQVCVCACVCMCVFVCL